MGGIETDKTAPIANEKGVCNLTDGARDCKEFSCRNQAKKGV